MNRHTKKAAFLILCAAAVFAASCGNEAQNPKDTQSETDTQTVTETAPVTEEGLHDALPEMDFNNATFRVWTNAANTYFYFSQQTDEVVEDAVYKRNRAVEERFHIKLDIDVNDLGWRSEEETKTFQASVMSGEQLYDLQSGVAVYSATLIQSGCLSDLSGSEYLSMTTPWWQQYLNDAMTINERQFQVSGYYEMPSYAATLVMYFNSEMIGEYDLEDPYTLVDSGEWTFDKMITMGRAVAADLNNDGKYDLNDRYGLATTWDAIGMTFYGTGYRLYAKDSDGALVLNSPTEALYNANDMIYNLCSKSFDFCIGGDADYNNRTGGDKYMDSFAAFSEGKALFYIQQLANTTSLRDMGTYGIIPIPKFTAEQEKYGTSISPYCSSVPIDAKNPTMSEVILEALAFESYKTVKPAYYDIALSSKYANDERARDMLDLIFSNVHVEPAYLFSGLFSISNTHQFLGRYENYASVYAGIENKMLQQIEQINELFENLPG